MSDLCQVNPQFKLGLAIGGAKIDEDIKTLQEEGCGILVGTVGRVWDMQDREILEFKTI